MVQHNQDNKFGNRVFQQFMDLFVAPEVQRRQETGELPGSVDVRAAQIIFFPDGRKPRVRINSEIKAIASVKLKAGISKKPGEPILEQEVEGLESINLSEDDDPDCAHATLVRIGNTWTIAFDFRYNKALSKKHIKTAEQFYEAAEFSFKRKYWASFIDNLFSASELLAKATLLLMPDPKFLKKVGHRGIQSKYNRFANLGNVEPVYKSTFNKLSGLRDCARYLKRSYSISENEACILLDIIKDMLEDIKQRIQN